MLIFAWTVTLQIGILVFIVAIGLVAQKATYARREARRTRLDEYHQQRIDPVLLEDLPAESLDPNSLPFRQTIRRFCEPIRVELERLSWLSRSSHRASLKRVMLKLSRELVGETLARLTLAFQVFGFVDEELKHLTSRRWWVRAEAARNLELMQAGEATGDLVLLLGDEEEDVRMEAAMALVSISGVNSLGPLLTNLRSISTWMSVRLSKSVIAMGSAGVPALVEALGSEHASVQRFCIDMLAEIGDIRASAPLIAFVRTAGPELRSRALVAIGILGDEAGKEVLLDHLSDENESIRVSAAEGLGYLGSPDAVATLKGHLLHDRIRVRLAAGNALKRIEGGGKECLVEAYGEADEIGKRVVFQFLE
ncbi:MAG TPA: HEAT repeat domain-containing protein, partial [Bacteroidota bacterium]|nr:HEAT repeat domain-containing protein [Bacteroidota bacterium]